MKRLFAILFAVFAISACKAPNYVRIEPETLLNASSEHVSFELINASSISPIATWVKDDQPSEAELYCDKNELLCQNVQEILTENSVPFKIAKPVDAPDSVSLIYDRVTARNCKTRGFGCSVSVNSLQMVSDHNHFIRPPLSDMQDAGKAVENYNRYFSK